MVQKYVGVHNKKYGKLGQGHLKFEVKGKDLVGELTCISISSLAS
jgi:hypothetical protein